MSAVSTGLVDLFDLAPPVFANTGAGPDGIDPYPAIGVVTGNVVELVLKVGEDGMAHYVVLKKGDDPPTPTQVVSGTDAEDSVVPNGSQDLTAGTEAVKSITGLTSETEYSIYVVARDAADNLANPIMRLVLTADVTPPVDPSISDVVLYHTGEGVKDFLRFGISGEAGATYSYTVRTTGSNDVNGSGTLPLVDNQPKILENIWLKNDEEGALPDGDLTISVQLTDAAGNTSSAGTDTSLELDTMPPTAALSYEIGSDSVSRVRQGDVVKITAILTEPIEDALGLKILGVGTPTIAGIALSEMTKANSTEYTFDLEVTVGNGDIAFVLKEGADRAGNVVIQNPTSGAFLTVDNEPPGNQNAVFGAHLTVRGGVSVDVDPSAEGGGTDSDEIWFAPVDIGSSEELDAELSTMTTAAGGETTITSPTVEGDYRLYVVDEAGNISAQSTTTLTVDNTQPPNQDFVFSTSATVKFGDVVELVSSSENTEDGYGLASDSVWFAPADIDDSEDLDAEGEGQMGQMYSMTTAAGDETTISSPTVEGDYRLYVVDEAGNISAQSTATLTVTAFAGGVTADEVWAKLNVVPLSELSVGSSFPPSPNELAWAAIDATDSDDVIAHLGDTKYDGDLTAAALSAAVNKADPKGAPGHLLALPTGVILADVASALTAGPLAELSPAPGIVTNDDMILAQVNAAANTVDAFLTALHAVLGNNVITSEVLVAAINVADNTAHPAVLGHELALPDGVTLAGVASALMSGPLSGLSPGLGVVSADDLLLAQANATADTVDGFLTALHTARGDTVITSRVLSTAIKLAGGHTSYALPVDATAQGVIAEFGHLPLSALNLVIGMDFTFTSNDLIIALANGALGDVSSVYAELPTGTAGGLTVDQLSAAIKLAGGDVGYQLPLGVAVSDVVAALSELDETVNTEALVIAMVMAEGDGLSGVGVMNTSNVPVSVVSLEIAVDYQSNINDSDGGLFLPSGVSASSVIGALNSAPLNELGVDPDGIGDGVALVPAVATVTAGELILKLAIADTVAGEDLGDVAVELGLNLGPADKTAAGFVNILPAASRVANGDSVFSFGAGVTAVDVLAKLNVAPLSELSAGSSVLPDATQLMLASIGSSDAGDVVTSLGDYKGDTSGDLTAEVLSTAIKLAGDHTSYALPAGVFAQDVIDEFGQSPLNEFMMGIAVPTVDQLILTLANAADTATLSDVVSALSNRGVTGVTSEVLSAAINMADVGGYVFPEGVLAADVVATLGELGKVVNVKTLILAIGNATDADGNDSVDLADVVLRDTSNLLVDLIVLQAAVNINDSSRVSMLPVGVTEEEVIVELGLLGQLVDLQTLRIALANAQDTDGSGQIELTEVAVGLSLDAPSMLKAAVVAARGTGIYTVIDQDLVVVAASLSSVTSDGSIVTSAVLKQMLDTYTDEDGVTFKKAVSKRLRITLTQLENALSGGGNFDAAAQNIDISIVAGILFEKDGVTLTNLLNALNINTNSDGETNFEAVAELLAIRLDDLNDALVLGRVETTNTLDFVQGLNVMSLPNKPDVPYTARSLADKIGDVTLIIRLNKATQRFEAYVPTIEMGDGFTLHRGEGYIVNTTVAKSRVFRGKTWVDSAPTAPPISIGSLSAAPSSTPDLATWAFVLAGKLPTELQRDVPMTFRLTDSLTGLVLAEVASDDMDNPVAELTNNSFRFAMVDQLRRSVVNLGDQFKLEVFDVEDRLIGDVDLTVNPNDLLQAFKATEIRYNQIPNLSRLLPNYPNPFNPETWIPFEINYQSEVKISIYEMSGKLVRTIDLGFQHAGLYTTRDRAAYWDGKSDLGERVASGIYFYSITAKGDKLSFTSTRQMVILK